MIHHWHERSFYMREDDPVIIQPVTPAEKRAIRIIAWGLLTLLAISLLGTVIVTVVGQQAS